MAVDPALSVIAALASAPPDWDMLAGAGVLVRIEAACRRACRGVPSERADDVLSSVLLLLVADGGLARLARRHLANLASGETSDLLALTYATAYRRAVDVLHPRYGDRAHAQSPLPDDLHEAPTPSQSELVERVVGASAHHALVRLVELGQLDTGSAERWRSARLAERLGVPSMADMAEAWGTSEGALRAACQRTARRIARLLAARGEDPIGRLVDAVHQRGLRTEQGVVLAVWSEASARGGELRRLDVAFGEGTPPMDEVRARYNIGSGRALGVFAAEAFEAFLTWSEEVEHGDRA